MWLLLLLGLLLEVEGRLKLLIQLLVFVLLDLIEVYYFRHYYYNL